MIFNIMKVFVILLYFMSCGIVLNYMFTTMDNYSNIYVFFTASFSIAVIMFNAFLTKKVLAYIIEKEQRKN